MKTNSSALLQQLLRIAQEDLQSVKAFQDLPPHTLTRHPEPGAWNALQCLEHLNLYAAFYLPEIEKALANARGNRTDFKSGPVGNMLVKMVVPNKNGKKMKTFALMQPASTIGLEALDLLVANQQRLIAYLHNAAVADLNHRGVAVTFTKLIKLRLGDALRFMVHHHNRHILQAKAALDV
jgi:uncharacterized damage-inducible protein DinB